MNQPASGAAAVVGLPSDTDVAAARAILEASGHVVLKDRSHRHLLGRIHVAESQRDAAVETAASTERWAHRLFDEQRRLSDRVNDIVAFAYEHGATIEDLIEFNARIDRTRATASTGTEKVTGSDTASVDR